MILHVGDFVTVAVLDDLRAFGPIAAVHGNMDEAALKAALPGRLVVESEGLRFGLVHDGGPERERHARLHAEFPECDVVVYGHSHLPEVARVVETWIVNPGSPTERRRAPSQTMAVVEAGAPRLVELG